jgi:hypothetical protein
LQGKKYLPCKKRENGKKRRNLRIEFSFWTVPKGTIS